VLEPGVPMSMYHWETDQEDFLVLSGEALLIVEGQERPLRQWDFVHCPPGAQHVIVGAGDGPCTILGVGSRVHHTMLTPDGTLEGAPDWGAYTVDEGPRATARASERRRPTRRSRTRVSRNPDRRRTAKAGSPGSQVTICYKLPRSAAARAERRSSSPSCNLQLGEPADLVVSPRGCA
jgi:hypothetical protein